MALFPTSEHSCLLDVSWSFHYFLLEMWWNKHLLALILSSKYFNIAFIIFISFLLRFFLYNFFRTLFGPLTLFSYIYSALGLLLSFKFKFVVVGGWVFLGFWFFFNYWPSEFSVSYSFVFGFVFISLKHISYFNFDFSI